MEVYHMPPRKELAQRRDLDWAAIQLLLRVIDLANAMLAALADWRMNDRTRRVLETKAFEPVLAIEEDLRIQAKAARDLLTRYTEQEETA